MCVIDIFSKYAWVVPLKDKKRFTIANTFQKIFGSLERKPNKLWVDEGSEFYNSSFKKWLDNNDIEIYSTYIERKSAVAERFIRTLKNNIYKHMTAVSKHVYFEVLDDIVDKWNNRYHRTIKINSIVVKSDFCAEYNVDSIDKNPKFKFGDHVRILNYKNIFAREYAPNWSEENFVISKVKNTAPWTYITCDLNGEKIVRTFFEEELQKTNQK